IPNPPGLLPCVSAEFHGGRVEGMIWNARIDVYTAVVVRGVHIIRHVGRLRIAAELRIIISVSWILHRAQRNAPHAWHEQPRADQDRKSTRLNSSHVAISYAVFCLKKKNSLIVFH